MRGVTLALAASIEAGASAVFSYVGAQDVGPSFKATLKTSTRTISPRDGKGGGGVRGDAGRSISR
jgi:hypothetical protein